MFEGGVMQAQVNVAHPLCSGQQVGRGGVQHIDTITHNKSVGK
jgi:hypothetical protein